MTKEFINGFTEVSTNEMESIDGGVVIAWWVIAICVTAFICGMASGIADA